VPFIQRDPQRVGHPFAVCGIGLQAVADVAELNLPGRIELLLLESVTIL
jgi:hypothetical protein